MDPFTRTWQTKAPHPRPPRSWSLPHPREAFGDSARRRMRTTSRKSAEASLSCFVPWSRAGLGVSFLFYFFFLGWGVGPHFQHGSKAKPKGKRCHFDVPYFETNPHKICSVIPRQSSLTRGLCEGGKVINIQTLSGTKAGVESES